MRIKVLLKWFHATSLKDLLAMQMKKDRLALNKQLDWLRARTNQNRMERLKKINDENEGKEKPESSDFN